MVNTFLALLPFSYAIQVLSGNKFVGVVPYLFLMAALLFIRIKPKITDPPLIFSLFIVYSILVELPISTTNSARLAVIYLLPILLFYIKPIGAMPILILTSLGVSIYEIIEFLSYEPTFYEVIHFNYIKELAGIEMGRWQGAARPGGLLDHVHASAFYCGVGLLGATIKYCDTGKKHWFIVSAICLTAVICSGMRIQVVAILAGLIALRPNIKINRFWHIFATIPIIILILIILTSWNYDFWKYYLGEGTSIVINTTSQQINTLPQNTAIGSGFMTTKSILGNGMTDDLVLVQIYNNIGAMGIISFLSLFVYGGWLFYKCEKNNEQLFGIGILIAIAISLIHSGVAIRKQIYPLIFVSLALIKHNSFSNINGEESEL